VIITLTPGEIEAPVTVEIRSPQLKNLILDTELLDTPSQNEDPIQVPREAG
jgi:hypothetical protein